MTLTARPLDKWKADNDRGRKSADNKCAPPASEALYVCCHLTEFAVVENGHAPLETTTRKYRRGQRSYILRFRLRRSDAAGMATLLHRHVDTTMALASRQLARDQTARLLPDSGSRLLFPAECRHRSLGD